MTDVPSRDAHNLGTARVVSRSWSGIAVHAIQMEVLPGPAWHQLACDHPVLSVVVNELGGQCEARLSLSRDKSPRRSGRQHPIGHISLIPAKLSVWGYSDGVAQVDEVRLILDVDRVKEILAEEFSLAQLDEPRLVFIDESLQALARLLATTDEMYHGSPLFGDSVVAAMIARLCGLDPRPNQKHRRLGLSVRQLATITDFIRENLDQPIQLSELAALADLSPSQFGRAFKTSTGTTPHRWHMEARIERAKRLLADRRNTLVNIALDTGFSEQSHFTRAFHAAVGVSPGAWRRQS
ncbi:MAG: AraC family transcriptional regulator [Rhodopila sp.]|jgi:AraC-like DNA-binding protein